MGKIIAGEEPKRTDKRYWLYETPIVYETGKNAIRYYKEAGKIQIATCDYVEARKDNWGEMVEERKPGKLCALDLDALEEDPETCKWLIGILSERL